MSFMQVSDADIKAELDSLQKSRQRFEKLNEKLVKDLEAETKKEDEWDQEIQLLERKSHDKQHSLEDQVKKLLFDWERDKKNLEIDLERLHARSDDIESELDDKLEKLEAQQEKELADLRDELARTRKGGEEAADKVLHLQEQLKAVQKEKQRVLDEVRINKAQAEDRANEGKELKKESKKLSDKIEALSKEEKELQKIDAAREESLSSIETANKQIKRLEKHALAAKSQDREISDLKRELADWEDKINTLKEDHARFKTTLKELGREQEDAVEEESGARGGRGDDSDAGVDNSEARKTERMMEELANELTKFNKQHQAEKSAIEEQIEEKNGETLRIESLIKRTEEEIKVLRDELKRIRDAARADEKERSEKLNATTNEFKQSTREIEKLRKDYARKRKEFQDMTAQLMKIKGQLQETTHSLQDGNYVHEKLIERDDKIVKEKSIYQHKLDDMKELLAETHSRLSSEREKLSSVLLELKEYTKVHDDLLAKLEEELYKETNMTESLTKDRNELVKEIKRLRWYFRPDKEAAPEAEVDPVAHEKFFERLREERMKDLHSTREKLKQARPKDRTLKELQDAFQAGLAALDDLAREDMGFELEDLNGVMTKLNMSAKQRFNMFVDFVECRVDPGIVRELGAIMEVQATKGLHPLKTAEHLMNLSKKDVKLNPDLKLRDVLLDRLALERRQRTGKDLDYCRIIILEGGEEWSEAEYKAQYG